VVIGSDGAVAEDTMEGAPTASYEPMPPAAVAWCPARVWAGRRLADEDVFWQEC
jgi:hypothetical protein